MFKCHTVLEGIAKALVLGAMWFSGMWILYGVMRVSVINDNIALGDMWFAIFATFIVGISSAHITVTILINLGIIEVDEEIDSN